MVKEVTPASPDLGHTSERPVHLLTRLDARAKLGGISDDKFYRLIREGDLPPPLKLGTSSRWLESDLDAFIAMLAEKRTAAHTPAGIRRHHEKLAAQRLLRGAQLALDARMPSHNDSPEKYGAKRQRPLRMESCEQRGIAPSELEIKTHQASDGPLFRGEEV